MAVGNAPPPMYTELFVSSIDPSVQLKPESCKLNFIAASGTLFTVLARSDAEKSGIDVDTLSKRWSGKDEKGRRVTRFRAEVCPEIKARIKKVYFGWVYVWICEGHETLIGTDLMSVMKGDGNESMLDLLVRTCKEAPTIRDAYAKMVEYEF